MKKTKEKKKPQKLVDCFIFTTRNWAREKKKLKGPENKKS